MYARSELKTSTHSRPCTTIWRYYIIDTASWFNTTLSQWEIIATVGFKKYKPAGYIRYNLTQLIIRDLNCNTATSTRLPKIVENIVEMANDHIVITSILLWHSGCWRRNWGVNQQKITKLRLRGLYLDPFIAAIILCLASWRIYRIANIKVLIEFTTLSKGN